eukprot:GEMP01079604.1.p1 GENE.GEMP01079604.1~~GEMP01079604.1.p1  ORF type:complete len:129 (-),score=2.09 GEMP01079604.1:113-499(-)
MLGGTCSQRRDLELSLQPSPTRRHVGWHSHCLLVFKIQKVGFRRQFHLFYTGKINIIKCKCVFLLVFRGPETTNKKHTSTVRSLPKREEQQYLKSHNTEIKQNYIFWEQRRQAPIAQLRRVTRANRAA